MKTGTQAKKNHHWNITDMDKNNSPEGKVSIVLPAYNEEQSIKKIRNILNNPIEEYNKRLSSIIEARRRVIEEYNLLEMINKIVINSKQYEFKDNQKIYSRKICRIRNLKDLYKFVKFKLKSLIK